MTRRRLQRCAAGRCQVVQMARRILLLAMAIVSFTGLAEAQNQVPVARFEIFGGYQLGRNSFHEFPKTLNSPIPNLDQIIRPLQREESASGYQASAQWNMAEWLGLTFNTTGSWSRASIDLSPFFRLLNIPDTVEVPIQSSYASYMGGPQFTDRRSRLIQPFGRVLVGGIKLHHRGDIRVNGTTVSGSVQSIHDFGFGYGAGGGGDFVITPRISARVSVDYVRSNLFASHQSNIRLAIGAVFHFGERRGSAEPAVSGS
jgi:hypothetical protein